MKRARPTARRPVSNETPQRPHHKEVNPQLWGKKRAREKGIAYGPAMAIHIRADQSIRNRPHELNERPRLAGLDRSVSPLRHTHTHTPKTFFFFVIPSFFLVHHFRANASACVEERGRELKKPVGSGIAALLYVDGNDSQQSFEEGENNATR